jgi:hypothetical protein
MKVSLFVLGVAVAALFTLDATRVDAQFKPIPTRRMLRMPPPSTPVPPPGISVQMQTTAQLAAQVGGPGSPPFSLGMASNFSVQTTPPATTPTAFFGQGAIQFAPDNDLANWIDQAAVQNVHPTLIITNATPQGVAIYTLSSVSFTGTQAGTSITASIQYQKIAWTFTYPNGQAPVYGQYDFSANRK